MTAELSCIVLNNTHTEQNKYLGGGKSTIQSQAKSIYDNNRVHQISPQCNCAAAHRMQTGHDVSRCQSKTHACNSPKCSMYSMLQILLLSTLLLHHPRNASLQTPYSLTASRTEYTCQFWQTVCQIYSIYLWNTSHLQIPKLALLLLMQDTSR